ncbi:YqcC family protein [Halomonas shantousis]
MDSHAELAQALVRLEATLKSADLWGFPSPPASAYDSSEPFCIDTMELPQWLRYVFIPRLEALIEANAPLPAKCDVAPAAEAWLQNASSSIRLTVVSAIAEVDRVITEA